MRVPLGGLLEASWGLLGASWGTLGGLLEASWELGALGAILGWTAPKASSSSLSWAPLRALLGASWGRLGASWGYLRPSWGLLLGASWAASWAVLGADHPKTRGL